MGGVDKLKNGMRFDYDNVVCSYQEPIGII